MLQLENITYYIEKGVSILDGLSLSISRNQFVVLAGENGSGKSILMKHCNALLTPQQGKVLYDGIDVQKQKDLVRQKIGLVFQNSDTQFVGQTVFDEIAFGPENLGWQKEKIAFEVLKHAKLLGISDLLERYPHFLSGGEKKRVAIAGVTIMKPDVIFFDEPFAGLDYRGVVTVTKEIVALFEQGCTIVVITHDLEKVLAYADRLVILKQGGVTYDGVPSLDNNLLKDNNLKIPFGLHRSVSSCSWL